MKNQLPVESCRWQVAGGNRALCPTRNPQPATRNPVAGFSLIEILVVVSLLSLIVLALMSVFSSTQRAFRASVTQADVMEGGRAGVELIASDLRLLTPSGGVSNVNFSVLGNSSYAAGYLPLLQFLPGSTQPRTNLLDYFFILGRQNTKWIGIGYVVDHASTADLYPLYRYYGEASTQTSPQVLFNSFFFTVANGQWTNLSRVMNGVVHLTVRAFDPAGQWINGQWVNGVYQPYAGAVDTQFFPPAYGEAQLYMYNRTAPASVEVEIGVLEDAVQARAESLPNDVPAAPPNDRRTLYLQNQSGAVHLFRQHVTIPNVDRTAYP